jgi:hypothetical protein
MANMGKSGGVNNQGGTLSAQIYEAASASASTNVPPKGTSNGLDIMKNQKLEADLVLAN